ncbi:MULTISPECIES: DUF418 domain-containing protein [Pseudonocardia]|uniref:DUF418 domain-containing protein n=3 Tax=Pseudonocardia TaxID=1847 RepID=A0A1Y2N139_PSEAH|nr:MULTISPECIES: DUF418 domain-containing protein [Pseudonocardia]OSY40628.1 hypothetical protein BG845_02706 [Pseudonocardia autotrophica]TDN73575.1 uncharacterized protein C8E95_2677 [Pseudonocardia autotrophica]BBG04319.1 membrane protein [Pseudonocardia autotrophica]GEC25182.1 membrane protein [Pseudonocardia saturnea]
MHDVDALRGFALLGIFVVNITFMASAYPGNLVDDPSFASPLDDAARFAVAALFSMKFYLLFSFLFGYSFVLQAEAARRASQAFVPRMLRRTLGLFLIGVAHIVLLYGGDVLTTYAVVCLILLAMHRVRDVVALRTAVAIYAFVVVSLVVSAVFIDRATFMPTHGEALTNAAGQTQLMLGGPVDIVRQHIDGLGLLVLQAVSLQGPTALAMFLLGMLAARRRLFSALPSRPRLLRWIQIVGFPVGIGGGVVYALLGADTNTGAVAVGVVTAPFLTAAYVAALVQLMHRGRLSRLRNVLAPVGRIALTNYLAQSVVGFVLFTGIGFGLAGRVSPPVLLLTAFGVFAGLVVVSDWWLGRHRYGPAEYLLRWFTNWRRPTAGSGSNALGGKQLREVRGGRE